MRRRGAASVALLSVMALVTGILASFNPLSALSASAAPGDPFDPADPYVYIAQNNPTQLFKSITNPSGTVTFTPEGAPRTFTYNALAYNPANNYLYAIGGGNGGVPANSFLRIGQNGVVVRVGPAPGVSISATFGPGGSYYMIDSSNRIVRMNPVNGAQISAVAMPFGIGNSTSGGGGDIAFKDGYFWSMGFRYILRIDPSTGAISRYPLSTAFPGVTIPGGDQAGAAWTFGNGNLGFSYNGSGVVYQIAVTNPSAATPTFTLVSASPGPSSANSDGAASAGLPTDFSIVKSAPAFFDSGDSISYTLTVTNDGPGNSSGWSITDTLPAGLTNPTTTTPGCSITGSTVTCLGGRTLAGATRTITIVATAPEATVCLTNTAIVTPNETDPDSGDNSSSVQSCGTGILALEKSVSAIADVNGNGITDAGDQISYEFEVSNTGAVDIADVAVSDPLIGAVTCSTDPVSPGGSTVCTGDAPYTVTQGDVDAGEVTNTATASALPDGATTRVDSAPSSAVVPTVAPAPGISIVKSASPSDPGSFVVGQEVTYSFVITNVGNVPLEDVEVQETEFTGAGVMSVPTCTPTGTLPVGDQVVCEATYILEQDDIDAAVVSNTAVAQGSPVGGGDDVVSDPSQVTIPFVQSPAVSLVKTATPEVAEQDGDLITYSFRVANIGNVALSDIQIDDPGLPGVTATCPIVTLLPGSTAICTAPYEVTQLDVDSGAIVNVATASALPPIGDRVESAPSTATVTIAAAPALSLEKTASPESTDVAGDTITYQFVITNTGNVTLTDAAIDELAFSGTGSTPIVTCDLAAAEIAPGDFGTCTAEYDLTQADADAGRVDNTAVATALPPTGSRAESEPDDATVMIVSSPALTLVKSADPEEAGYGDVIEYSFLVTNTGNVTLDPISITEQDFSGTGELSAVECPEGGLGNGESFTCTASYVITAEDVAAGSVENTATASGLPPAGASAESAPSSAEVAITPGPALTVVKSANVEQVVQAGQVVTYSFVVTNVGTTTLTDITILEVEFSGQGTLSAVTCDEGVILLPAEQTTCTATYVVVAADLTGEPLTNLATATALPPDAPRIESDSSTATIDTTPPGGLAFTGMAPAAAAPVLALVLLGGGALLAVAARRRQRGSSAR